MNSKIYLFVIVCLKMVSSCEFPPCFDELTTESVSSTVSSTTVLKTVKTVMTTVVTETTESTTFRFTTRKFPTARTPTTTPQGSTGTDASTAGSTAEVTGQAVVSSTPAPEMVLSKGSFVWWPIPFGLLCILVLGMVLKRYGRRLEITFCLRRMRQSRDIERASCSLREFPVRVQILHDRVQHFRNQIFNQLDADESVDLQSIFATRPKND